MLFKNKTAIITGASTGIGRALAEHLAEAGCNLALIARNKEKIEIVAKELGKYGVKTKSYACDVSDYERVKTVFSQIKDDFGEVDYLINNAGITFSKPLGKLTIYEFDQEIDVNLKGVYYCTVESVDMIKDGGSVINMGSERGRNGTPSSSIAYAASKAGVHNLTKSFALQLASRKIRVNSVAPAGVYPTEMTKNWPKEKVERAKAGAPLGRLGKPEDIVNAISFLLSDKAEFITGQILDVNGGVTMR